MRRADLPARLWTYYNQNDKKTTRRPKRGNAEKPGRVRFPYNIRKTPANCPKPR